jgi:hypothetical protein
VLPQCPDQFLDCVPPRLRGAIFSLPIPNGVDVDASGIGELLLRQAGEYSRGAQVTAVTKTIDVGSGHVLHRRNPQMVIVPPFSYDRLGLDGVSHFIEPGVQRCAEALGCGVPGIGVTAMALLAKQSGRPSPKPYHRWALASTCTWSEIYVLASPRPGHKSDALSCPAVTETRNSTSIAETFDSEAIVCVNRDDVERFVPDDGEAVPRLGSDAHDVPRTGNDLLLINRHCRFANASSRRGSPVDAKDMLIALLRAPTQAIHRRIISELNAAGFEELRMSHMAVLQYPGPDGVRPGTLAKVPA